MLADEENKRANGSAANQSYHRKYVEKVRNWKIFILTRHQILQARQISTKRR